jgi:hypothetical protein
MASSDDDRKEPSKQIALPMHERDPGGSCPHIFHCTRRRLYGVPIQLKHHSGSSTFSVRLRLRLRSGVQRSQRPEEGSQLGRVLPVGLHRLEGPAATIGEAEARDLVERDCEREVKHGLVAMILYVHRGHQ